MTIDISNNAARVNYTVASGVTQTSFSVPFEFFNDSDLSVYVDDVLKTITTHYTVSGGDGSTGTITMSVTGAAGGSTVVISRSIAIERTSDFQTGVDINRAALNTQLDTLTAIAADNQDKANRSITAPNSEVNPVLELPDADTRKGKLLGFDDTTGNVVTTATLSDISTLNAISADIGTLADIEDGTDATDAIQTVAGISSNVTTVAGINANVTTVAGISANVTTVAGDTSNIGTVATNIADVNTAATNITEIQNASANATTATTKASEAATSASNASTSETNAATSATAAATSATTATTKAGEASTSATNAATSETNAGNSATAAASSASAAATSETNAANSAAAAATALDNFDDRYLGSKTSDPTVDNDGNALVSGALYFNSTANEMRVYDGANWIAASSAGTASLILYEYTATSGQTTFSGADDNSASLSYSVGNIQVVMNGIVLDPSDFTATSGTSVVLASGAATDDLVNIYAFKSFTVADTVSASAGGTFAGDVTFNGAFTSQGIDDNATSTAMTLDSSGNVGIGTSSPDGKLHVAGTLTIADSSDVNVLNLGSIGGTTRIQGRSGGGNQPLTFWTNDSERMRIDSSGNLLAGKTSTSVNTQGIILGYNGRFYATSDGDPSGVFNRKTSDGTIVDFRKDNNTVGSIGSVSGNPYFVTAGGSNQCGISPVGGSDPRVIPVNGTGGNLDNGADLGYSNARWDDIWATNGTIQTSDRNDKQDIEALSDAEQRVAVACKGLLRKFRWIDAVAEKGDDARIHFGIIAQDLQDAFAAEGLDAGRYAMFISTTWWETQTEVPAVEADEENGIEAKEAYTRTDTYETLEEAPEGATERTRLGVRYPELLAFIIGAM